MSKKTVYNFLKKTYPKHLILFSKNNKICCYKDDFNIYKKYNNISYIIVKDNKIIKRSYKNNLYEESYIKYNLIKILKKVRKRI